MGNSSIISATAVFSQMDEQQRLFASLSGTQPVLNAIKAQQDGRERILASVAKSPVLEAFAERHGEMRNQILKVAGRSPALEAFAGQQQGMMDQIVKAVGKTPALEALAGESRKWQEQILKAADASSAFDSFSAQHRERYRQLLASVWKSPTMEQAFKNWNVTLPPGLAEQMVGFQAELLADIVSSPDPAEVEDGEEGGVWFGAESWSRLYFEMVTILKCAELMTAGMTVAKEGLGAPIPAGVLYLLYMFIAAGELAAHLAKDALADADG